MNYDPESLVDRKILAQNLQQMFTTAGFVLKTGRDTTEDIYERDVPEVPGVRIVVFSSIYHGAVRAIGTDAIRVAIVFTRRDGEDRFLLSETRVHRTGTIEGIVDRTLQRMRASFVGFRDRQRQGLYCKFCNAPFFKSKRGHEVCANTCWINKGQA